MVRMQADRGKPVEREYIYMPVGVVLVWRGMMGMNRALAQDVWIWESGLSERRQPGQLTHELMYHREIQLPERRAGVGAHDAGRGRGEAVQRLGAKYRSCEYITPC
jgi:hypothetical protein